MKILYPIIDGEITGGNMVALWIIEEALRRNYQVIVNSPTEGKFTHILSKKGLVVYNIDTRRSFRFDSAIKLARIIKKEGVNLVHSHTPLPGTILSRIAAKLSNIPVINHEHGLSPLNPHHIIRKCQLFLNAFTAKMVTCRVIAVSQATKAGLIQRGIPENIIRLVHNGVLVNGGQTAGFKPRDETLKGLGLPLAHFIPTPQNREPFSPADRGQSGFRPTGNLGLQPGRGYIIGQVGRIDEKKGQHILIQAARNILKEIPNVLFLIIGEDFQNGVYQKKLETLAKKLGIMEQIIFTGYRPDIKDLMNALDLFVLPSSAEGLPLVIIEAMAAKKPVITTSLGGNAEVVIDGETGTLIPVNNPDKLSEAIIYHLKNPEISKIMGENGYKRAKQLFSLSEMVNKVMDIYREIPVNRGHKFKPISVIKIILRFTSRLLLGNQKGIEYCKRNPKADKILVVSLTHLGDMVLLSPFLRNLRKDFPKAKIDVLLKGEASEILEYCPHINNCIIYNAKWVTNIKKGDGFAKTLNIIRQLRKNQYDLSFVTHPHIFSNMIPWLAKIPFRVGYSDEGDGFLNACLKKEKQIQHARDYPLDLLRYLDLKVESDKLEFYLGQGDVAFAERFRKGLYSCGGSFLVGVHPGAGKREKIWLPQRYAEVIRYLLNKYNTYILLFAGKQEVDITEEIKVFLKEYEHRILDLTAKTSVRQMAALMGLCKVILANDAGPMHVASALDRPIVALFAAAPDYQPKVWGPLSEGSKVVWKPGGVEDIQVEDVTKALDEALNH